MVASYAAVGCLSNSPAILSQWRGYAADGAGIAIGINSHVFQKLDCEVRECVYSDADHASVVDDIASQHGDFIRELETETATDRYFEKINSDDRFFNITCELLRLKNVAFSEEKEVRIIKRITDLSEWKLRVRDSLAVPYVEFNLAEHGSDGIAGVGGYRHYAFPELWYGPKCNDRNKLAFEVLLPSFTRGKVFDCGYV